jgi:hypothetical protein
LFIVPFLYFDGTRKAELHLSAVHFFVIPRNMVFFYTLSEVRNLFAPN